LYRMNNAAKGTTNQNVLVSPEAELVKQTFEAFGKITWQSFVSSRLPLLKKSDDVLDAIRRGDIHYTKGILIASVKNADDRQALLTAAIKDFMSVAELKRQIALLNQSHAASAEKSADGQDELSAEQFKQRMMQTLKQANSQADIWEDTQKRQKLARLLKQLEALIQ
jgi:ParB family transcriptional regulator, chromosome partitioning protein